jgi:fluoride exporter
LRTVVGIAVLGAVGALARNGLDGWVADRTGGAFPWGTLVINATGCFLLGLLYTLLTDRYAVDPSLRFALTTGFLGAYTTFSTFSLETVGLLQQGRAVAALGNVGLSLLLGLGGVYAGILVARTVP